MKIKSTVFYSNQLGDYVVDELCKCGHLKSEHGSRTTRIESSMLRDPNKGSCCSGGCVCKGFVFARYVGVEEAADAIKSKRDLVVA